MLALNAEFDGAPDLALPQKTFWHEHHLVRHPLSRPAWFVAQVFQLDQALDALSTQVDSANDPCVGVRIGAPYNDIIHLHSRSLPHNESTHTRSPNRSIPIKASKYNPTRNLSSGIVILAVRSTRLM